MTVEQIYQRIENRMDRFDKKLNTLIAEKKQEQWVRVSFIQQATGWNADKLYQARKQGLVVSEKRKDGRWYDLNSIPTALLINKA